ncbi:MAG: histidine phosphatase family protein [Candidatus Eisenbacteria bacterium]|nr:histidine phosphatase family protein [Candidatus Eisenbacteria bacterium]
MRVILFRHAPAEARDPDRWPDDDERPLTARGVQRARKASRGMVWLERGITHVITSPAARAAATADALLAHLGDDVAQAAHDALAPGGSWRDALRRLAQGSPESVTVLVGHEPDLGKLAGVLLFGAPTALPLKKAGACAIDLERAAPGAGRLRWWLPPRALRALARRRRSS